MTKLGPPSSIGGWQNTTQARGIQHVTAASLPAAEEPHPGDSLGLERAARQQWESSPAFRVEFGDSFECYLGFYKADKRGLVKIISREA